ncbi:MAG: sigma-70 family RNA polymerase sigma factor [Caldilineaceae bacterium]|nr:sigma-70 family RNA polymerase sigma factor [Caldilineaceae bacterium]
MTDDLPLSLCTQAVQNVCKMDGWSLSEEAIGALATAVFMAMGTLSVLERTEPLEQVARQYYTAYCARCEAITARLSTTQQWKLTDQETAILAKRVLPYVLASSDRLTSDDAIGTVIVNYYVEGPMVQAMLTKDAVDHEELWTRWREYMLNVARSKGLIEDDAEELVQAVYFDARKGLTQYRYESTLSAYFFSIFTNRFRGWLRRMRKSPKEKPLDPPKRTDDRLELVDTAINFAEEMVDADYLAEIVNYVKQEIVQLTSTEDFEILYYSYVEQSYVDNANNVVKLTDAVLARMYGMTINGITAKRLRAERKIIKFMLERLGAATVEKLVGQPAADMLQLYYVEHRYKDPKNKRWQIWTNEAIAKRLAVTVQYVREERPVAVQVIGFAYARKLLQDESP